MLKAKKHPRRKPIPGLTPAEVVQQMAEAANGKDVRKVRGKTPQPKESILSKARPASAATAGEGRIFGALVGDDDGRAGGVGDPAVPDNSGKRESQLSKVLKRMLGQAPPMDLLDIEGIGQVATNSEALAAVIWREALAGRQWAVEMVRDQTEGKPQRAAPVDNSDGQVEEMLDRVGLARLNELSKGK